MSNTHKDKEDNLIVCELKSFSYSKFCHNIKDAYLIETRKPGDKSYDVSDIPANRAKLAVPWARPDDPNSHYDDGKHHWEFNGMKRNITGTMLIVEDMPDGSVRVVGSTEVFYNLSAEPIERQLQRVGQENFA